ncbi:TPA: CRISPR-associated protein Cas2 [Bacillus cereus]
MHSHLITYDLIGPNRDYDKISEKIKTYPRWAHILESVWVIKSDKSTKEIRDELLSSIDNNDRLFVSRLTGQCSWNNLNNELSQWLHDNV